VIAAVKLVVLIWPACSFLNGAGVGGKSEGISDLDFYTGDDVSAVPDSIGAAARRIV